MVKRRKRKLVKKPRIHKIISEILNPKLYFGSKSKAIEESFYSFLVHGEEKSFSEILSVVLKNKEVRNSTNYYFFTAESTMKNSFFSSENLSLLRVLEIYKTVLSGSNELLNDFFDTRKKIEESTLIGDYDNALALLDGWRSNYGFSFWAVKSEFLCYALKGDSSELNKRFNYFKSKNKDPMYQQILGTFYWVAQSTDPTFTLNMSILRDINEFMSGGAYDMAAINSITNIQYPIGRVVRPSYAIHSCQMFNIVDLYIYAKQTLEELCIDSQLESNEEGVNLVNAAKEFLSNIPVMFDKKNSSQIIKKTNNKILINIEKFVRNYDEGNYKIIVDEYEGSICISDGSLSLSNIIAKSYVNLGREPSEDVPYLQSFLIKKLIKIYTLKDVFQSIKELVSLSHKTYLQSYSIEILQSISVAAYEYYEPETRYRIFMARSYSELPCTPISLDFNEGNVIHSTFSGKVQLSPERKLKLDILAQIKQRDDSKIAILINSYNKLCKVEKDGIDLYCYYLCEFDKMEELLSFCSDCLMRNENSLISFPKEKIREYITKGSIYNESSVIFSFFYDHYNETSGNDFAHEVFEEYIFDRGGNIPSSYINDLNEGMEKELFIFLNIADTSAMEYLGVFDSTEDLYVERLRILSSLTSKGLVEQEDIGKEFRDTIDKIIVSKNTAMIANSKIHIDIDEIYKITKDEISTLLSGYQSIEEEEDSEYVELETGSDIEQVIVKGRKSEILTRIIDVFQEKFVKELDETLSSEIRHGFFGNLLTSKLQERHILCELGDNNTYLPNAYWKNIYHIVNNSIVEDVDNVLRKFSENYNTIIEKAERWIHAGALMDESDALFRIIVSTSDFEKLKNFADKNESFQSIFDFISKIHFDSLEHCLNLMKKTLNEEFINDVDALFLKLKEELHTAKKGTSLSELTDSISLVHNEIKEDVRTICEWFAIKSDVNYLPVPIESVVKIAENCFRQSFYFKENINIKVDGNVLVESNLVYSIVLALINCFSNGAKHGAADQPIDVVIKSGSDCVFSIMIKNKITLNHYKSLTPDMFDPLQVDVDSEKNSELLRSQGGSGLYKSQYYLNKASRKFTLHPFYTSNEFQVKINYD